MSDLAPLSEVEPAHTPLYDLHRALGARFVPFAGYAMPVHYALGIIGEHHHTRAKAGLFDVSHMGQAVLRGREASGRLETLVPGDIVTLSPGRLRYTFFLDEDGHILDDLMVTRLSSEGDRERLFLVVNAGPKIADFRHLSENLPDLDLVIEADKALLALQGPRAAAVLARRFPGVERLDFMTAASFMRDGEPVQISRSGYTGEDGFEISLAAHAATALAEQLLADPDVLPIGLGARDSLRLEAGLCLYGHDIDQTTDPVEAGLGWTIPKRRREEGGFPGSEPILETIRRGPSRRRVGFSIEGKVPAREGASVTTPEGEPIGKVTSGGFSPSLGYPIAMGYVAAEHSAPGAAVHLLVRGKPIVARVTKLPFVPHHYFGGSR